MKKILLFILFIFLMQISSKSVFAQNTLRWIHPNYDFVFNHPLETVAWGNYFIDESQLDNTLSRTDVFGLFLEEIGRNDGNFLSNLVPIIKKRHISIATEGTVTTCNPSLVDGNEWANYILNSLIKPLYDAGGTLDYYAIDNFPGGLFTRYAQKGCISDINQAIPELIKFMK